MLTTAFSETSLPQDLGTDATDVLGRDFVNKLVVVSSMSGLARPVFAAAVHWRKETRCNYYSYTTSSKVQNLPFLGCSAADPTARGRRNICLVRHKTVWRMRNWLSGHVMYTRRCNSQVAMLSCCCNHLSVPISRVQLSQHELSCWQCCQTGWSRLHSPVTPHSDKPVCVCWCVFECGYICMCAHMFYIISTLHNPVLMLKPSSLTHIYTHIHTQTHTNVH